MSPLSSTALQVALFRTFDGMLHAVDNQDPFSAQFVLSRDLRTGGCVTDPSVSIPVHEARRNGYEVEVRVPR